MMVNFQAPQLSFLITATDFFQQSDMSNSIRAYFQIRIDMISPPKKTSRKRSTTRLLLAMQIVIIYV